MQPTSSHSPTPTPPVKIVHGAPCVSTVAAPISAQTMPSAMRALNFSLNSQAASSVVNTGLVVTTTAARLASTRCSAIMKNTA